MKNPPLAAPLSPPLPELDIPIIGGRLTRDANGCLWVHYPGLPPVPSWPHDTPLKRAEAAEVAGGCLFRANFVHELIHGTLLPAVLGLPHSPTIHAAAQRAAGLREDWHPAWGAEEDAVLAVRRLAALLGVDVEERARRLAAASR
jgi:hypothetical protein